MDPFDPTTIICPVCGAVMRITEAACSHCGHRITRQAVGSKEKFKRLLDRPWFIVVLMLHVGLLGIPVYWKTRYSLVTKLLMVIASIVYTVGAVAIIVIMVRWLFRMVTGG